MTRQESWKKYNDSHKEEHRQYYLDNREKILQKRKERYSTKEGRARHLIQAYRQQDKEGNRGQCTLTVEELVSIIDCGCKWCGEKDWRKLGADRIDNSKPHTFENCVCSCLHCNAGRERQKVVLQYAIDGQLISEYKSETEASRQTGISQSQIDGCCKGKYGYKTAGGYVWKYKEVA